MTNTAGKARPATRAQAEAVLALVEKKYAAYLVTFPWGDGGFDFGVTVPVAESDRPFIAEHWGDDDATVIVWENNSPDSWALNHLADEHVDEEVLTLARDAGASPKLATSIATVKGTPGRLPKGVYTESYFSFVLAVYQED